MRDEVQSKISKSLFLGIIMAILGFAVFLGFKETPIIRREQSVDITPGSGMDWKYLKEDMFVKIRVQNAFGYYVEDLQVPRNLDSKYRKYMIMDVSDDKKDYDYAMGVFVKKNDFPSWDRLSRDTDLASKKSAGLIVVEGHLKKSEPSDNAALRMYMSTMGIKPDELDQRLLPYTIVPEEKSKNAVIRYIMLIVGIAGVVLIIINVVNMVLEKRAYKYLEMEYAVDNRPLQESPYAYYEREEQNKSDEETMEENITEKTTEENG